MTNNPAVKVLHCLPALHDQKNTTVQSILKNYDFKNGIEITNNVFQKNQEIIFNQSENKLHTIKAILISTLIKNIDI